MQRSFGFKNIPGGNFAYEDSVLQGSVEGIFSDQNITPKFVQVIEITKPSDSYTSDQTINSAYAKQYVTERHTQKKKKKKKKKTTKRIAVGRLGRQFSEPPRSRCLRFRFPSCTVTRLASPSSARASSCI